MRDVAYRVIADHIRTLTFAITDGALPDKEGRGYVLRRILRRAVRYGWQYLNVHKPFLCELVPAVVEAMGDAFPELRKNPEHVIEVIREEEGSFARTLDNGIKTWWSWAGYALITHFNKEQLNKPGGAMLGMHAVGGGHIDRELYEGQGIHAFTPQSTIIVENVNDRTRPVRKFALGELTRDIVTDLYRTPPRISGQGAFKLHDTFGFPIDLTEIMARERGMRVDVDEYERLMAAAKDRARKASRKDAGMWINLPDMATDDSFKYSQHELQAHVVALSHSAAKDSVADESIVGPGCDVEIYLDRTCFYAEQGGQVGDQGTIEGNGWRVRVMNTLKGGVAIAHIGVVENGKLSIDFNTNQPPVTARLDRVFRGRVMQNHTATHVMNWALREVLGEHVQQKGSLVDPDKTRFDLSHPRPITNEEIERIEALVKEQLDAALQVDAEVLPLAIAQRINGVRAVFGEKYPDPVRVVSIGKPLALLSSDEIRPERLEAVLSHPDWRRYSVEFCGGTHVSNTRQIERFVITHEEAVAKGIRRVVAVTGEKAAAALTLAEELAGWAEQLRHALDRDQDKPDLLRQVGDFEKRVNESAVPVRARHQLRDTLAELHDRARRLQKEQAKQETGGVLAAAERLLDRAEKAGGAAVVVGAFEGAGVDQLRAAADSVRSKAGSAAVLFAAAQDGKVVLLAAVTADLVQRGIRAGDLIRDIAPVVGGKGGGRPDMAQGGGTDAGKIPEAVEKARAWLVQKLSA